MTHPSRYSRIAFVASTGAEAQEALAQLIEALWQCRAGRGRCHRRARRRRPDAADAARYMRTGKPIYGMHRGTVGFLMNEYSEHDLHARLAGRARHRDPSAADARHRRPRQGRTMHHAINEVSLFRQTHQAARLRILVDGEERMAELIADGVWWRRRRARPPTISRRRGRSCRSTRRCWR